MMCLEKNYFMAPIGAHGSRLVKLGQEGGEEPGSGRSYLRQDAVLTRRQGRPRYDGVVDSWIGELFVAENYLIEPSIYRGRHG